MRWLIPGLFLLAAGCIPPGGGGGGDDDGGQIDPDDGIPPGDMFVDPDDGVPPPDMFVDPDDGVPPPDMFVDPDDGVPPPDRGPRPDGGDCGPERCNGLDDDCDGAIDEDFGGLGEPCFIGVGLCEAEGSVICTPDGAGTVCDAVSPGPVLEQCNGFDDDCDGAVDEDQAPQACATNAPGRCAEGLEQCVDGEPICIPRLDPAAEACSGIDEDCDGRIDEGQGGGGCETGLLGFCAEGVEVCADGRLFCQPSEPGDEQCNGGDDDCDGAVDEDAGCDGCDDIGCPPGFACVDGECRPNGDCDGVECPPGFACAEGECVPVEPGGATPIAAEGGSIFLEGALTADDPLWDRMTAECAGRRGGQFHYDALRIVNASGIPRTITVTASWEGGDGFLHVFDAGFDPASEEGCLGGDDDFGNTDASQVAEVIIGPAREQVIVASTFGAGRTIAGYVIEVETLGGGGVPFEAVCDDRVDDDGNGLVDCEDPACDGDPACPPGEPLIEGVQQNVRLADVEARGWRLCYSSAFSSRGDRVDLLLAECDGPQLMLACRRVGDANLLLAAEGSRAAVTFDVGATQDVSHNANGVEWYYSPGRSWGFAPGGAAVNLVSCDFGLAERADQRMCVHLSSGDESDTINIGYRCGDNDLSRNGNFERLVLTR